MNAATARREGSVENIYAGGIRRAVITIGSARPDLWHDPFSKGIIVAVKDGTRTIHRALGVALLGDHVSGVALD